MDNSHPCLKYGKRQVDGIQVLTVFLIETTDEPRPAAEPETINFETT